MVNCFFDALRAGIKSKDFYNHFPNDEDFPKDVFEPYMKNVHVFGQFLHKLAGILHAMYGYTITEKTKKESKESEAREGRQLQKRGVSRSSRAEGEAERSQDEESEGEEIFHYVTTHVLVDGERVTDRLMGDWIHYIQTKQMDLSQILSQGYYSCGHEDGLLILLCEFTGLTIINQMPEHTCIYSRLRTPVNTKIYLRSTKSGPDNGHASFERREELPPKPFKRKFTP